MPPGETGTRITRRTAWVCGTARPAPMPGPGLCRAGTLYPLPGRGATGQGYAPPPLSPRRGRFLLSRRGHAMSMDLPEDDGRPVTDDEWDTLREETGAQDAAPPTAEERAAILDAIRKSRP